MIKIYNQCVPGTSAVHLYSDINGCVYTREALQSRTLFFLKRNEKKGRRNSSTASDTDLTRMKKKSGARMRMYCYGQTNFNKKCKTKKKIRVSKKN